MIQVRPTRSEELPIYCKLEQDADTHGHITPQTLAQHQLEFNLDDIIYLSICDDDKPSGFMILALEADLHSVELRRIVVASKGLGIGQAAMSTLQKYCSETLQRRRIWLDVYVFNQRGNQRGRHVYEKLGYQMFNSGEFDGRKLLCLQKSIGSDIQHGDTV